MAFTDAELGYLRSQRLGRLATVADDGQPDNAAVGFRVNDDHTITIGGIDLAGSRKGRNVWAGNEQVAFLVDDLVSVDPWHVRGIRIYATAELSGTTGDPPHGGRLRLRPTISWSWGIEPEPSGARGFNPRRTVHAPG